MKGFGRRTSSRVVVAAFGVALPSYALVTCAPAPRSATPTPAPVATQTATPTASATSPEPRGPLTPRRPVVTRYHGVDVRDDYAWLEDGRSPEVQRWVEQQNRLTRSFLDGLPDRARIGARIRELVLGRASAYYGVRYHAGVLFAIKRQPPKQWPFLVVLASENDLASERVLVDPNQLDPTGKTSID